MSGAAVYGMGSNDSLGITVSVNTATLSGGAGNDTFGSQRVLALISLVTWDLTPSASSVPTSTIPLSTAAISPMPLLRTVQTALASTVR